MSLPTGCAHDWDDLIAAMAAHELLVRLFDDAAVGESVGNAHRAARRCGWDESKGDAFAWAARMVGHYRNLAPRRNGLQP